MKGFKFVKDNGNSYSQSIYNKVIPYDEVFTFQVKIISAPKRLVGIGVVDYEKYNIIKTIIDSEIAVGYYWDK